VCKARKLQVTNLSKSEQKYKCFITKVLSTPQFRRDVNASELVKGLPDSLLSSLSLSTLEKADLSSVDQLQGRGWTSAQVHKLDSHIKTQIYYNSIHFSLFFPTLYSLLSF